MSRRSALIRPLHDWTEAIVMPLKALLVVGLCDRFDAWVARQQPGAAEVLQSLRASRPRGPV